jgi:hypothetical protein
MEISEGKIFDALFDFSFSQFVTTRVIKFLYILGIGAAGLASISWVVTAFRTVGILAGILALLVSPIVFLFFVLWARVSLELVAVVFRIANYTAEIARQGRPLTPPPSGAGPVSAVPPAV